MEASSNSTVWRVFGELETEIFYDMTIPTLELKKKDLEDLNTLTVLVTWVGYGSKSNIHQQVTR